MASTTTYGDFPGVKITTAGGAITGVAIGREQKVVLIGDGNPGATDTVDPNTLTQIDSSLDAERKFGADTELANGMQEARGNGANISFLYGVMLDEISVTDEDLGGVSGTLANAPIVEDTDEITITGDVSGEYTVVFKYDSPPTNEGTAGEAYVNPITGAVEIEDDGDATYTVDYTHYDYESALAEAATAIGDEETGLIVPLEESGAIATDLSAEVNGLRGEYKLAMGVTAAEPNANQEGREMPDYNTANYADSINNDAVFLHAPARKELSTETITPALAGYMAGAALGPGGSIYNDNLTTDNLDDRLSKTEANELRDANVIPIRQPPQGGSITIGDNTSTSDETDWIRDYWRRRIVDQTILIAKTVGDSAIGQINDERTRDTVEDTIRSELKGLNDDRLITNEYFVEVYQVSSDEIGIDLGVTPQGIAKRIDVSITINT